MMTKIVPQQRGQDLAAWETESRFRDQEEDRREENADNKSKEKPFVSHSWRDVSTQEKKRRIISFLSKPPQEGGGGLAYWADYLDLQAQGPVPWRLEIQEAIQACSKFIAIVDRAYLTSFNCLQELAVACIFEKPLVIIVVTQDAWELLTVPGGAEVAKKEADAVAAAQASGAHQQPKPGVLDALNSAVMTTEAWNDSQYGPALYKYEGEHIVPGESMSLDTVRKLFSQMSSVNLCPCRELEEQNWGWNQMLQTALSYVEKDLVYNKEHAQLANKAEAWVNAVQNSAPQPLLQDSEATSWAEWLSRAEKHSLHPVPTKKMGDFVKASLRHSQRRKRIQSALIIGLLVVLMAGVAVSTVFASLAEKRARAEHVALTQAQESQKFAELKAEAEVEARVEAQKLRELADQRAEEAIASSKQATALLGSTFITGPENFASEVKIKVLNGMLERLPSNDSATTNNAILGAGHQLLGFPFSYTQQVLKANSSYILSLDWSPDGRYVASTSGDDNMIRVWTVGADGSLDSSALQVLESHDGPIYCVRWSPDGSYLASASIDSTVRIWEKGTDTPLESTPLRILHGHNESVLTVAWALDGSLLASGSEDSTVHIWDMKTEGGDPVQVLMEGMGSSVISISWSLDGTRIASVSETYSESGDPVRRLVSVRIWASSNSSSSRSNFTELQVLDDLPATTRVAFSPDGQVVATAASSFVFIFGVNDDGTVGTEFLQRLSHSNYVMDFAWSSDGSYLASAADYSVYLWMRAEDGTINEDSPRILEGKTDYFTTMALSPDGHRVIAGSEFDGLTSNYKMNPSMPSWDEVRPSHRSCELHVWVTGEDGALGSAQPRQAVGGFSQRLHAIAYSPDFRHIASAYGRGLLATHVLNAEGVADEASRRSFEGHTKRVMSISYSPDGRFVATASWDSTARIWAVGEDGEFHSSNAATQVLEQAGEVDSSNAAIQVLEQAREVDSSNAAPQVLVHADRLNSATWSPDGRHLVTGGVDSAVRIWAVDERGFAETNASQVLEGTHPGSLGSISSVKYSPDGRFLACGGELDLLVWSVDQDGKIDPASAQTLSEHTGAIYSVAWSKNGHRLASTSYDRLVRIWPVDASGVVVPATGPQVLAGHTSAVMAADWHPDGNKLATVSRDSTVRIWSVSEDWDVDGVVVPPQVFDGRWERMTSVAWSPDGKHLAIPSMDGQINGKTVNVLAILGLLDINSMKQAVHQGIGIFNWTITESDMTKPGFPLPMMGFSAAEG